MDYPQCLGQSISMVPERGGISPKTASTKLDVTCSGAEVIEVEVHRRVLGQLDEVSEVLKKHTGWSVSAVPAWVMRAVELETALRTIISTMSWLKMDNAFL